MKDKKNLIKKKVEDLNQAAKAYYQENREIMSNLEYDAQYDELLALEEETGIQLSNSPTRNVGYEAITDLPKESHNSPMLSLDKTKEVDDLVSWLGDQKGILSWKIDGITVVLTYRDGKLFKGVTRGNGEVGEVITNNAKMFENIPLTIPFKGELVLRGEAFIKYSDFQRINRTIEAADAKYKNPRNLCSGTVRQLNNKVTAERNVNYYVFSLVSGSEKQTREQEFAWLSELGFDIVEHKVVTADTLPKSVEWFAGAVEENDVPSDGLVLIFDNIEYGKSLGATSKFPRDAVAFKWRDEVKETTLKEIEWSASRTGLINPVAIFDPVELEGTTVSRASVHNISIVRELELGIGDRITVYKANMIIPQVAENLTKSKNLNIPEICPVCSGPTAIKKDKDVEVLYCTNPDCLAKQLKSFTHFVSRNAMNIDGLSEATLEKLIARGYVTELADLFKLDRYREEVVAMEGLGEKSFDNLMKALKRARNTTPAKFIYSLGIAGIGVSNAKVIAKACKNSWDKLVSLNEEALLEINGIGDVMAQNYIAFFSDPKAKQIVEDLLEEIELDETFEETQEKLLDGKTFVVTGSLLHYKNRDAIKALIEAQGGKVAGSVSSKTDYLINNDLESGSSKNKKARELDIPIITEETFIEMVGDKNEKNA